jgi:cytochrome P450
VSFAVTNSSIQAAAELPFDVLSLDFIRDPYPAYHRLRREDPMHWCSLGFYLASRHADIAFILRDHRFGKDFGGRLRRSSGDKALEEPVYQSMLRWMVNQNPPAHTRLRGLLTKAFSNRSIEDMRPRIQEIVNQTLDQAMARGRMDLIADFARRLPVTVICDLLGIPENDRQMFFTDGGAGARLLEPLPVPRVELDSANAGNIATAEYFQVLLELRRCKPGNDLTTLMARAGQEEARLLDEDLVANLIFLFGAGHATTVYLIGNALLALYRNPDQLHLLKSNPTLNTAVDEFLRYDSPLQVTTRTALEDVVVSGMTIKKGEHILCLIGAGNRDPDVYPNPDRLDITRKGVRPFSFGGGIHFCLGAQLARIEAEIAIGTLLRRLPDLAPDDLEAPDWLPTFVLRGLKTLPASLGARPSNSSQAVDYGYPTN